jgi:ferredoxin
MRALTVEWEHCRGHGLCAELLPELVDLDDWGFPVITGEVPEALLEQARGAVRACPALALRLRS